MPRPGSEQLSRLHLPPARSQSDQQVLVPNPTELAQRFQENCARNRQIAARVIALNAGRQTHL